MIRPFVFRCIAAACALSATLSLAQDLSVSGAWIRPTVPGQMGTGGFMSLSSKSGVRILGVKTDVNIGTAELHEMKMDGAIMRMRAVPHLDIAAGTAFELKPGGHHLMIVDLKQALMRGTEVPVTFTVQAAGGKPQDIQVKVKVASRAPIEEAPASSPARKQ